MWCVTLFFIAVVSCNAEDFKIKAVKLPLTADNRIIGGTETTIQKYPFTIQVIYYSQFLCGGSILTKRHVLSAAHCFIDQNGNPLSASRYAIRAGTTYLNSGGSVYTVSSVTVHESYNTPVRDNDVALVLTTSSMTLGESVNLARIPYQGAVVPDNATVIAVGWGLTNVSLTTASRVLNEVSIRKINLSTCQARYMSLQVASGYPFPVTSSMICAGILDVGGKDACQGDSGGPLIYAGVVVGITSWGNGCAEPNYPGVSARVSSYTNWILNAVNNSLTNNGSSSTNIPSNNGTWSNGTATSITVGAVTILTPIMFLMLNV